MSISLLYHSQRIAAYEHISYEYEKGKIFQRIRAKKHTHNCSDCKSKNVTATSLGTFREIKGLKMGAKNFSIKVEVYRNRCHDCGAYKMEKLEFTQHKTSRLSKALERSICELLQYMSIKSVAEYFDLHWETVKNIHKQYLQRKHKNISLKAVRVIGVDEVYIGKKGFLTIVRDLESGAVLFVSQGKGASALDQFNKRLRRSKVKIRYISMDMANSYSLWARTHLPNAIIIYDHFHVIKLMNDKLNAIRRRLMSQLDTDAKSALKGMRFHLLRNQEDLYKEAATQLQSCLELYEEINKAHFLKEMLRGIYQNIHDVQVAAQALEYWHELAMASGISEMKTMAKTIKQRYKGVLAYWYAEKKITSASMEGFNNKIGWASRQAFGYRELEYFILVIYDLPNISTTKAL